MKLQEQSVNIILTKGIDTKTNSKLVEGKLLEMENCEINNEQIIKSPGTNELAKSQTALSVVQDQKAIINAYNTMIVADNNSIYKYNSDQNVLNKIENCAFSSHDEINVVQNISEILYTSSGNVNQLSSPYFTYGAPFAAGYNVMAPISCQFGVYLFTVTFVATATSGTTQTGYYQIVLLNTSAQTQVYESVFPFTFMARQEVPADCIATPAGIFMYTIDYVTGKVYEYFMTYDLSIIQMLPSAPASSDIFPINTVFIPNRTTINNLTNYVVSMTIEYSDSLIFFAFRQGTAASWDGMIAVRDLGNVNVFSPQLYINALAINTTFLTQTLCSCIFNHPISQQNYFVAIFGLRFIIIDTASFVTRASFPPSGIPSNISLHSVSFLQSNQNLVVLLHDIREFDGIDTNFNIIAPTVYQYNLEPVTTGSLTLTVTPQTAAFGFDPRWVSGSFGTSAIAGPIFTVYDKIFIPILYFAYLTGTDGGTNYDTPKIDLNCSAHLTQFISSIDFPSPLAGMTNLLNHVSWLKDYSCSLYTKTGTEPPPNRSMPPALLRTKATSADDTNQTNNHYVGFFVQQQTVSIGGQVFYLHQLNSYAIQIPDDFNFQGFPRGAFYFGFGKLYELTRNTISEQGFFAFPQISIGATAGGGTIAAGKYLYAAHYEWTNGNGELVRSAVSEVLYTLAAGAASIDVFVTPPAFFSNKTNAVVRIFRSTVNGRVLFSEANIAISNPWPLKYVDSYADTDLEKNEIIYTNGGVLQDFPFPAITSFTAFDNSIYAIDENNRNQIFISKTNSPGFALSLIAEASIQVETTDGPCTFLAKMDDKLIIFKKNTLYFTSGQGPSNVGAGSTLFPPQFITSPVGCNQPNSIVVFPNGIIFKSQKGIWQLDRSLNVRYIGADVEAYNDLTISSAELLSDKNKVKFTTLEGIILVYDYYYNTWNIETYSSGIVDTAISNNIFTTIDLNGVISAENDTINQRNNKNYSMRFTTGWVKLAGLIGFQRLYKIMFLGDYQGSHVLKASIYYDYNPEPLEFHYFNPSQNLGIFNAFGNYNWGQVTPYAGYQDSNYLFRINVRQQLCTSVKITIEDVFTGLTDQTGSSFSVTALNFDIGVKSATAKVPSRLQT